MKSSPTVFSPEKKPWYRRKLPAILVGAAALAIIVISDYPRTASVNDRAAQFAALQTEVWTDVQSCNAALSDSLTAVTEILNGSSKDLVTAYSIVTQDEPNCSPVGNSDLLDLASINAPNLLRNYNVQTTVNDLYTWAFPQAAYIILDFRTLLKNFHDTAVANDIVRRQKIMDVYEKQAQSELNTDAKDFGIAPKNLGLITLSNYPTTITGQ